MGCLVATIRSIQPAIRRPRNHHCSTSEPDELSAGMSVETNLDEVLEQSYVRLPQSGTVRVASSLAKSIMY